MSVEITFTPVFTRDINQEIAQRFQNDKDSIRRYTSDMSFTLTVDRRLLEFFVIPVVKIDNKIIHTPVDEELKNQIERNLTRALPRSIKPTSVRYLSLHCTGPIRLPNNITAIIVPKIRGKTELAFMVVEVDNGMRHPDAHEAAYIPPQAFMAVDNRTLAIITNLHKIQTFATLATYSQQSFTIGRDTEYAPFEQLFAYPRYLSWFILLNDQHDIPLEFMYPYAGSTGRCMDTNITLFADPEEKEPSPMIETPEPPLLEQMAEIKFSPVFKPFTDEYRSAMIKRAPGMLDALSESWSITVNVPVWTINWGTLPVAQYQTPLPDPDPRLYAIYDQNIIDTIEAALLDKIKDAYLISDISHLKMSSQSDQYKMPQDLKIITPVLRNMTELEYRIVRIERNRRELAERALPCHGSNTIIKIEDQTFGIVTNLHDIAAETLMTFTKSRISCSDGYEFQGEVAFPTCVTWESLLSGIKDQTTNLPLHFMSQYSGKETSYVNYYRDDDTETFPFPAVREASIEGEPAAKRMRF